MQIDSQPSEIGAIFFHVEQIVRRLRGRRQFRGQIQFLPEQKQVRIPVENRAGSLQRESWIIHVHPKAPYAETLISKEKVSLADLEGNWEAFMEEIITRARGEAYLRTQAGSATYRKQD